MINIIAAINKNGIIGKAGKMPWHYPGDLRFFAGMTKGGTLIMGKKTFLSIGRVLPGRRTIVVSSSLKENRIEICDTFEKALQLAKSYEKYIWIVGGREVYRHGLKVADTMFLTKIPDSTPVDDDCVLFPFFGEEWKLVKSMKNMYDDRLIIDIFERR